jgi:glycosyltransferase involved in cell wall biosynthesis
MHLGIDIREACKERRTGKGQWTFGFVSELLERNIDLTLFCDAPIPVLWTQTLAKRRSKTDILHIPVSGLRWHMRAAAMLKRDAVIDAYVSTVSYIVPLLVGKRKKIIPIVHDLIAFRNEPHDRKATFIEKLTLKRAAEAAFMMCTVSDATKNELLKKIPNLRREKIVPIYAASGTSEFSEPTRGKYILCVATLCPRKNQERLIRAYASLPEEIKEKHPLVLAGGRGWQDEEIVRLARNTPGVEWRGYVTDEECSKLYDESIIFAYPSLYEGFGLPVLDAFHRGVPVLTSAEGGLKDVAGEAAHIVDPLSEQSIANGLKELLENGEYRSRLRQSGKTQALRFSWPKTVDAFLEALGTIDKNV